MKRALLLTIRLYQRLLSPLLLPACRYVPTCSQYAHQAVELHGSAKGAMLAAWRLLRCHPLARGGYDPVPPDASQAHVADDRVAESCVAHAPLRVQVEAPGFSPADTHVRSDGLQPWA
jgi:putative membrane protein insertion efficiency factor